MTVSFERYPQRYSFKVRTTHVAPMNPIPVRPGIGRSHTHTYIHERTHRTQEVTQDPRKVPFYFEYLFAEATDPRREQVRPYFRLCERVGVLKSMLTRPVVLIGPCRPRSCS